MIHFIEAEEAQGCHREFKQPTRLCVYESSCIVRPMLPGRSNEAFPDTHDMITFQFHIPGSCTRTSPRRPTQRPRFPVPQRKTLPPNPQLHTSRVLQNPLATHRTVLPHSLLRGPLPLQRPRIDDLDVDVVSLADLGEARRNAR
jgi:hypothetical protein